MFLENSEEKKIKGVSRMFQWSFFLQFNCCLDLIAPTRAEGWLVYIDLQTTEKTAAWFEVNPGLEKQLFLFSVGQFILKQKQKIPQQPYANWQMTHIIQNSFHGMQFLFQFFLLRGVGEWGPDLNGKIPSMFFFTPSLCQVCQVINY